MYSGSFVSAGNDTAFNVTRCSGSTKSLLLVFSKSQNASSAPIFNVISTITQKLQASINLCLRRTIGLLWANTGKR